MKRCKTSATTAPAKMDPRPYSITVAPTAPVDTDSTKTHTLNATPISGSIPPSSQFPALDMSVVRCCQSAAAAVMP